MVAMPEPGLRSDRVLCSRNLALASKDRGAQQGCLCKTGQLRRTVVFRSLHTTPLPIVTHDFFTFSGQWEDPIAF